MSVSSEKTSAGGRGNIHDRLNTKDQPCPEYIAYLLSPRRRQKQKEKRRSPESAASVTHRRALCSGGFWTQGHLGNLQRSRAAHLFSLPFLCGQREHRFLHVPQHCLSPGAKTDFINLSITAVSPSSHNATIAHSQSPTCITSPNKVPRTLPHW